MPKTITTHTRFPWFRWFWLFGLSSILVWAYLCTYAWHAHADNASSADNAENGDRARDHVLHSEYAPWAVYYNDQAPLETFAPYKLLVFDSKHHPRLPPLKNRDKMVLGYISLGEIANHRHYFPRVQKQNLLLRENPQWPGSYYVDVRDPFWTALVVEELVPAILHQGFNGIFLDTLDDAIHLEETVDPKRYAGMKAAAANLVKTIHKHYPDMPIMMNRGFALLPEVAQDITFLLMESARTEQDPQSQAYRLTPEAEYQNILDMVKKARSQRQDLTVMSLDYWDPSDTQMIQKIYAQQRKNNILPYVSTVKLDTVVPEPKP